MRTYSLETAALINHATTLVALNGIYSDGDREAAAHYILDNCLNDPISEPEENRVFEAVAAMLQSEPPAKPGTIGEAARKVIWSALYETAHNGQSRDWFFDQVESALNSR